MDKISGIVPAGRRFRNVDVSRSQPVRPGAPSFGRPVGRASQVDSNNVGPVATQAPIDRVSLSENAKLQAGDLGPLNENMEISVRSRDVGPRADEMPTYKAPTKPVVAASVEEMTQKFFSPQKPSAESEMKFESAPRLAQPTTSVADTIQQDFSRQNPYSSSEQSL